jgi:hypothetical protein
MKKDEAPEAAPPVDTQAETAKEYRFKHSYIGTLGVFHQGKSYPLTKEQRDQLKEDLE